MEVVGTIGKSSKVDYYSLDAPLESIDFLYNEYGICNVKFIDEGDDEVIWTTDAEGNLVVDKGWHEGDDMDDEYMPYAIFNERCIEGADGVGIMSLYTDGTIPLVGLRGHGTSKRTGLESLGFIWWDSIYDRCE